MVDIPIVLVAFNRPDLVAAQLNRMRKVKPAKIYYIVDGPRPDAEGEDVLVEKVRAAADDIDWDCTVERVFADENMGCDPRVVSGLNYVFSREEMAIILEDDCIPCESFFYFCSELLKKYADNQEIMYISGIKQAPGYPVEYSYGFSYNTGTWGWATWSRAWKEWHWDPDEWNRNKEDWLKGVYSNKFRKNWIKSMESYFTKRDLPWDYVWRFCVGRRLSIFPAVNLVENVGFGEAATHTSEAVYGYDGTTYEMKEIIHPPVVEEDLGYPRAIERQYAVPLFYRIRRKLKKIIKQCVGETNAGILS